MFAAVIKILTRSHCVNLPPAGYRSDKCTSLRYLRDFLNREHLLQGLLLGFIYHLEIQRGHGGKGSFAAPLRTVTRHRIRHTALQRCRLSPILKAAIFPSLFAHLLSLSFSSLKVTPCYPRNTIDLANMDAIRVIATILLCPIVVLYFLIFGLPVRSCNLGGGNWKDLERARLAA